METKYYDLYSKSFLPKCSDDSASTFHSRDIAGYLRSSGNRSLWKKKIILIKEGKNDK